MICAISKQKKVAVVVAALVERSIPTPEVPPFKSSHWQKNILNNVYLQLYGKYKNKEKEAGNGPFFK